MPLISIVIPTFNSDRLVAGALQSLAVQQFRDFEAIVSDGASSDHTVAVARGFAGKVPGLQVSSRPDQGVYDAINRGIEQATGEWLLVLGSDDKLHSPQTLADVAAALRQSTAPVVHGDVRMMAENLCGVPPGGRYAGRLSVPQLLQTNVCQQAIFYRRRLFSELGLFNTTYRLYADWDFNLRAAFREPLQWIDVVVADYAATGMSAGATDKLFIADMPALVRRELLRWPANRALWPLQNRLLRDADTLRRRGEWSPALQRYGDYVRLLVQRIPVLLGVR
jgi:glycosyltransferase involved in cell wall biosynthesis